MFFFSLESLIANPSAVEMDECVVSNETLEGRVRIPVLLFTTAPHNYYLERY